MATLALCVPLAQAANSVLWVGDSRTYIGNLPEVYRALVKAVDQRDIRADMLVETGGDLDERVRSQALARELKKQRFDAVILQERGNLASCMLDKSVRNDAGCKASAAAFANLARIARANGARVYVMGTHQESLMANRIVNRAEAITSVRIKADGHVPTGMAYLMAQQIQPGFRWVTAGDGFHPDRDLTLLMAAVTYYAIEKKWPEPVDVPLAYRAFDHSVNFGDDALGSTQNTHIGMIREVVPARHLAEIIEVGKATMK
ncbi:hypothetical protein [Paraburkholderia sp.]|uniref:hypothetical protein n=1 Tax=Paraburkholderia sp. TaxID=1926495 RepID=UPI0025F5D6D7|nr:hypothetical protein [Paraburkholderia sp.]